MAGATNVTRKGSPNKTTVTAKENLIAVFEAMGGRKTMTTWATENQTEFYKLYGRLLPLQVTGEGGAPIKVIFDVRLPESPDDGH